MREESLRSVLLVKAVEEADRTGALVPPADRATATREASRDIAPSTTTAPEGAALPSAAQRMLAVRAETLRQRIVARHPFVDTVLALARGPAWAGWLLVLASLLVGLALSSLDGTRRINVLAFALLGLVAWNFLVYAAVLIAWLRRAAGAGPSRHRLAGLLARIGAGRVRRLVARSAAFDARLAEALSRFLGEWYEAARPLLIARATRTFHLAAAAVGIGLIGGLYLRGIALDYQAGWESTFLDAQQVQAVLAAVYGPASSLTRIPVPDAAHLESIRFRNGGGGESAARWIHLLAATALIFVVLPRLLLASLATLAVWRWSLRAPLPPALVPYFRSAFSGVEGVVGRGIVAVVPYAYEPGPESLARLRTLLPAALGENLAVDLRTPVRYGDEDGFIANLADRGGAIADTLVLLLNLSATPEDENHGSVIAGVRDWLSRVRPHAQLLVVLDEGPYRARMAAQGGAGDRLAERRETWRNFVSDRGIAACFLDLSEAGELPDRATVERVRDALWQPAQA
jgi:hypothetical protein